MAAPNLYEWKIASTLRYIGDYAFRGCKKLINLIIGDSVVSIGRYAFANCEVLGRGTVSFGKSLETIVATLFIIVRISEIRHMEK